MSESPNNPENWRPIVDPECPAVVEQAQERASDPLDLMASLSYEAGTDWEIEHHKTCERCQRYNQGDDDDGERNEQPPDA